MEENKQTQPMTYDEAISKLGAFILKSREEEKQQKNKEESEADA